MQSQRRSRDGQGETWFLNFSGKQVLVQSLETQQVATPAKSNHLPDANRSQQRTVAKLLTCVHIAHVHLDDR
jgi:hypothetical protein